MAPHFDVDNLSMAMSLVISTGGIALMSLYAGNLAPPSIVTKPIEGDVPTIDQSLGYR